MKMILKTYCKRFDTIIIVSAIQKHLILLFWDTYSQWNLSCVWPTIHSMAWNACRRPE